MRTSPHDGLLDTLKAIRSGCTSRAEVMRATGYSEVSVIGWVRMLAAHGLITESAPVKGQGNRKALALAKDWGGQ